MTRPLLPLVGVYLVICSTIYVVFYWLHTVLVQPIFTGKRPSILLPECKYVRSVAGAFDK
jgi:hypothetical protein